MTRAKKACAMLSAGLALLTLCTANRASADDNSLPKQWAGVWALRKDLGAPGISALSDREARALLGQRVRIGEHQVLLRRGEECARPAFRVSTQTTADFLAEFNVTAAQFPLIGNTVEILDIKCEKSVTYRLGRLANGCVFYPRDGRFFQLQIIDDRRQRAARDMPACLTRSVK
jgi:hypothetical protein